MKAPSRIQYYKDKYPNLPLPPQPVITRWGTWLDAALFYADNYDAIKSVIDDLTDSSTALSNAKNLLKNKELKNHLIYLKINYSFVPRTILKLENTSLSLIESVSLINQFESECKKVSGAIGSVILNKFNTIIKNNTGYQVLKKISTIFAGDFEDVDVSEIETAIVSKLNYAQITSVDVERSFSIFKHMFTDKRHNFLLENFEKYLVGDCFYNLSHTV